MDVKFLTSASVETLLSHYARLMPGIIPEVVRWRFGQNVAGPGLIGLAFEQDKLLGMTPFMAAQLKTAQGLIQTYHAIDTVVSPEARGKGVFIKLGKATCAEAKGQGIPAIYGFPNAAAAKGWFKYNGWSNLGRAPLMICPVRTGLFVQRVVKMRLFDAALPSLRTRLTEVKEVSHFDERFDELWRVFSRSIGCAVDRSSSYLNWRFAETPGHPYTTVVLEAGPRIAAFVTYRTAHKHGGHLGYVMEGMAWPGREDALLELLRWVRRDLKQQGVDAILGQCLSHSPNYDIYRDAGFLTIPDWLVPQDIHFGALPFTADGAITGRRENWYLSYLDSDSV